MSAKRWRAVALACVVLVGLSWSGVAGAVIETIKGKTTTIYASQGVAEPFRIDDGSVEPVLEITRVTVKIPQRTQGLVDIRFNAETDCAGKGSVDLGKCGVIVTVDGVQERAFTVDTYPLEGADGVETHGFEHVATGLSPGAHDVAVLMVRVDDETQSDDYFTLANWTLVVEAGKGAAT